MEHCARAAGRPQPRAAADQGRKGSRVSAPKPYLLGERCSVATDPAAASTICHSMPQMCCSSCGANIVLSSPTAVHCNSRGGGDAPLTVGLAGPYCVSVDMTARYGWRRCRPAAWTRGAQQQRALASVWERCCCWGRVSGGGGVGFWRRATPHHVCALIAGKYTSGRSKSRFGEATGMAAPGARGAAARRSAGNGGLYVVSAVCSCCRCEQQPHHHASINNTSPPLLAWVLPSPPPPPSRNRRGKPTAPAPVAA